MITVRNPGSIYQASGKIQNGTFHGRWHFSFDQYYDPEYTHFGTLRVFNDDTLSPGRPVDMNGVQIPNLGAAKNHR